MPVSVLTSQICDISEFKKFYWMKQDVIKMWQFLWWRIATDKRLKRGKKFLHKLLSFSLDFCNFLQILKVDNINVQFLENTYLHPTIHCYTVTSFSNETKECLGCRYLCIYLEHILPSRILVLSKKAFCLGYLYFAVLTRGGENWIFK